MRTEPNNGSFIHKKTGGYFEGHVITEWLTEEGDDRRMRIVREFIYVDLNGNQWIAPAGTIVDGASIPRLFWTVADPFSGDYRNASVIHDWLCNSQQTTWQITHKLFAEMMKISGVPFWKRRTMAFAVYRFGPRWKVSL